MMATMTTSSMRHEHRLEHPRDEVRPAWQGRATDALQDALIAGEADRHRDARVAGVDDGERDDGRGVELGRLRHSHGLPARMRLNRTMKMSGNANVKNAAAGLRQKAVFS